jgi:hypothetical protein
VKPGSGSGSEDEPQSFLPGHRPLHKLANTWPLYHQNQVWPECSIAAN